MTHEKNAGSGRPPKENRRANESSATGGSPSRGEEITPSAATPDVPTVGGQPGPPGAGGQPRPVGPRRERYLVAPLPAPAGGLQPFEAPIGGLFGRAGGPIGMFGANVFGGGLDSQQFIAQLDADPSVTVHKVIRTSNSQLESFGNRGGLGFPEVAVVEMDPDRASMFAAASMVHVEPDLPLVYCDPAGIDIPNPGLVPLGEQVGLTFLVRGSDGAPLPGADVYVMSNTFPAHATSGPDGIATLDISEGALTNIRGIYVKPSNDHWSIWFAQPDLSPDVPNLLTCPRLTDTFPGFPERQLDGWGRRAMRFDALPPTLRGHGVKVAIVDSGAAVEHPDLLGRVVAGRDIPGQNDTGWRVDTVGHGSHCAGIIGGVDDGAGIVGLVPEAELHSCKIFPGGRFSDLIEALDYCIEHSIDVVNLSLGSPTPSELVGAKIEQARQAGVACVVAAGNSSGPVAFPASMPSVLAVAAIGKIGEYPPESYHATQVAGTPTAEGYFSAKFTCHGPEVDVCGPGVAVVSSVPPHNYAAFDGTSFAGPHVAGLAALVLAHHADFRDRFMLRNAARVDRLFEIIRGSCRPLALGDPGRSGAGLPDATIAVGAVTGLMPPGFAGYPGGPAVSGYPVMPGYLTPGVPMGAPPGSGWAAWGMISPAVLAAMWAAAMAQARGFGPGGLGLPPGVQPAAASPLPAEAPGTPAGPPAVTPPPTPSASGATPAGGVAPGTVTPGVVPPGGVTPSDMTPGDVTPGDVTTPGATTPGATTPGAITPGAATPGAATSGPGTPPTGAGR
ncbi:MAG: S8 family serine peptidase, partial [Micromonosporaceae bacterium]